jgi:V8-like Glu-specific endopeptidase
MKKFMIFSILMVSVRLMGQTFNPNDFIPIPTPVWSAPTSFTGHESQFVSYNLGTGEEQLVKPMFTENNDNAKFDEPFNPGLPDDDAESEIQPDNFNNCEYIQNTSNYHLSTYAKLFITFPDGYQAVGSGTMIGRCVVITAGHCVYDKTHGGWLKSVTVIPGYNENARPFGECYGTNVYSWEGWTVSSNFEWDMGMIKLNRSVGDQTGTLGYGYNPDDSYFRNNTFHNMGYPAEYPFTGQKLYYCYGNYDQAATNILYYNRPNYGGNSGGATYKKETSGDRIVYAVHSHTTTNGKSGQTRITKSKFDYIYQIVHETCPTNIGGGINPGSEEQIEFSITPNPAREMITFKLVNKQLNGSIIINDMTGREIHRESLHKNEQLKNIDISGLKPGYYFISVVNGSERRSESFIKLD